MDSLNSVDNNYLRMVTAGYLKADSVLLEGAAAVPRIKTTKSKKSQLWVFPACPKNWRNVAEIFWCN